MYKYLLTAALLSSAALLPLSAVAQTAEDQSVITYDKEYFVKFAPSTLLEMLQRVPGVQAILDANRRVGGTSRGGQQERGLGSGGDQILINNKRLSGKANNINNVLQRISASQVERVEIVRGASSDLDVQSQGLVVNIIMDESESNSSTFWKVGGRISEGYLFSPDLQVSHNASKGNLDYIIGIEAKQGQHIEHRLDEVFTPELIKTADTGRNTDNVSKYLRFNSNLTYNTESGNEFRLNGQYEPGNYRKREPRFRQNVNELRQNQNWDEDQTSDKWEVGGDFSIKFNTLGTWRTLFIANRDRIDKTSIFSNVFVTGNVPGFRNTEYRVKKEKILRSSFLKNIFSNQLIEIGAEAAINNFDKLFTSEDFDAGVYSISINDDVAVKENRYEIFTNHTYNITESAVLQSSLIGEFSKISSVTVPIVGENIERSRNFSFLKPRVDFRYDFTDRDQLRATIERKVSQLDFQNFVASFDVNNDILRLGNTAIVPEKSLNYNLVYEHRLPNDAGALQLELFYRDLTDYIELVDFTQFEDAAGNPIPRADIVPISKSGNIPTARSFGVKTTGSLRLGFFGLPNAVISVDYKWEDSNVEDQFSGIDRPFKWLSEHEVSFNFRHDITDIGLSYGFNGRIKSDSSRYEVDEVASTDNGDSYEAFTELNIGNNMRLIFIFEHITDRKFTTDMRFYNDHIRYNDLSRLERRDWRYVREWSVFLQGTF